MSNFSIFNAVKVRLQARECPTSGPWNCFNSIVKEEGFRSLYRGLSSPLIGAALETGVNYGIYEYTVLRVHKILGTENPFAIPVAAATAGVFLSFIVSPAELIKCRMQLGSHDVAHRYSGPIDCGRQLIKSEGVRGVMRGLGATLAREVPGNAIYFGVYKYLRRNGNGKSSSSSSSSSEENDDGDGNDSSTSFWQIMQNAASAVCCGAVAGMAMWTAVLPIDVAKTRIQTAWPGTAGDVGLLQQLQMIYREGGRRALYAGLTPTLIRAAPANAAQWLTYEWVMESFARKEKNSKLF